MLFVAVLTVILLLLILPIIQELIHRFVIVGVHLSVSKYDVDNSAILDFP